MQTIDLGPGPWQIPGVVARVQQPRGTVIFLHGQYVDPLANRRELAAIAEAGFHVVGIDAPRHGRRLDPDRDTYWDAHGVYDDVLAAGRELPTIVDALEFNGLQGPYGIVGVSLGALSLWVALVEEPRLEVGVPILGTPQIPGPDSAHHQLDTLTDRAILALNAAEDEVIPLEATERACAWLREHGGDAVSLVLRRSAHHVHEHDWNALWDAVPSFLRRQLT